MSQHRFSIYCECADEDCVAELWLTLDEWNEAKSQPNRSVVVPGHPLSAGERVIAENERFSIAEGGTPPV